MASKAPGAALSVLSLDAASGKAESVASSVHASLLLLATLLTHDAGLARRLCDERGASVAVSLLRLLAAPVDHRHALSQPLRAAECLSLLVERGGDAAVARSIAADAVRGGAVRTLLALMGSAEAEERLASVASLCRLVRRALLPLPPQSTPRPCVGVATHSRQSAAFRREQCQRKC